MTLSLKLIDIHRLLSAFCEPLQVVTRSAQNVASLSSPDGVCVWRASECAKCEERTWKRNFYSNIKMFNLIFFVTVSVSAANATKQLRFLSHFSGNVIFDLKPSKYQWIEQTMSCAHFFFRYFFHFSALHSHKIHTEIIINMFIVCQRIKMEQKNKEFFWYSQEFSFLWRFSLKNLGRTQKSMNIHQKKKQFM